MLVASQRYSLWNARTCTRDYYTHMRENSFSYYAHAHSAAGTRTCLRMRRIIILLYVRSLSRAREPSQVHNHEPCAALGNKSYYMHAIGTSTSAVYTTVPSVLVV